MSVVHGCEIARDANRYAINFGHIDELICEDLHEVDLGISGTGGPGHW
jgi:hypothetical protein